MCNCHPDTSTPEFQKLWKRVKDEPRTEEDWRDLHDAIEGYRLRLVRRHAAQRLVKGEVRRG